MKKDTRSNPPHHKIWKYWLCTDSAYERLKEIDERLNTKIADKLCCIDYDFPECWACKKQRGAWSKFERCHIIPRALGGKSDPSNFFLMCKRCHQDSPTSGIEDAFWLYVHSVKSIAEQLNDIIEETASETGISFRSTQALLIDIINSQEIIPVAGEVPMKGLRSILKAVASQQRSEDQSHLSYNVKVAKKFEFRLINFLGYIKLEKYSDLEEASARSSEDFLHLLNQED